MVDLAFGGRVLAQERGDGVGFSDLLGEGALHVFDGRVGARVEQELHDVGELAGRCFGERKRGGVRLSLRSCGCLIDIRLLSNKPLV